MNISSNISASSDRAKNEYAVIKTMTSNSAIAYDYPNPDVSVDMLPWANSNRTRGMEQYVKLRCLYCNSLLDKAYGKTSPVIRDLNFDTDTERLLSICPACGWWAAEENREIRGDGSLLSYLSAKVGAIVKFDELDSDVDILEIRRFLCARWENRKSVSPRMMEEVVSSVFRDKGFSAITTPYSNDGGIDSVLTDSRGRRIGIQVKHTNNSIEVEALRSLTGALWLGGFTSGIFVTTSRFRSGAWQCAEAASAKGIPITLLDAKRFFEELRESQIATYNRPKSPLDYFKDLILIREVGIGE